MTVVYLIVAALIVAAIYFGLRYFVRASQLFSGERVIICPESGRQAMVEIDTKHAAITSLFGQTDLRLENCARWPIKQDCGQECLLQFDVAPAECLVRSVLEKWYRDKNCSFCEKRFSEISMVDHKPALLNAEGVTVEWQRIPLSAMTEVMATYLPVCWNCHVAQSFRREHPELVVDRTAIVSQLPPQSNQSSAHR